VFGLHRFKLQKCSGIGIGLATGGKLDYHIKKKFRLSYEKIMYLDKVGKC
jgi:hypothetical protein